MLLFMWHQANLLVYFWVGLKAQGENNVFMLIWVYAYLCIINISMSSGRCLIIHLCFLMWLMIWNKNEGFEQRAGDHWLETVQSMHAWKNASKTVMMSALPQCINTLLTPIKCSWCAIILQEHFWISNGGFITDRLKTVRRKLVTSQRKNRKRKLFTMVHS